MDKFQHSSSTNIKQLDVAVSAYTLSEYRGYVETSFNVTPSTLKLEKDQFQVIWQNGVLQFRKILFFDVTCL